MTPRDDDLADRVLVQRTLAGDADAFTLLHRRYYARVFRHALFRCRSTADAEDIAAETFVKAVHYLPQYRFQGESILPWLCRIATNLVIDQGRRTHGQTPLSLESAADDVRALMENLRDEGPNPHELAERHETQSLIRTAIARLAPDQADAILLRFGGDLSLQEIALALGRTEGAVKSLIHRGLVNLRKTLLEEALQGKIMEQRRQTSIQEATQTEAPKKRYGTHIEL
ncbi:RNA polymerase sigma factor [Armatimonas rosea]|uniref:RNA polymerase sigma-70 factor (ECF subfamily) n=1 Tax=Armatimonas rosea TaxID=685828 RepID=A0A7W9SNT8_ARMRO|nr:sigma-70 family RNA polymerase sigma factor [Armatimonas rosea]MBB6050031.1 RNA polymerase sigma-70 factor (ECF subfamily) [Armatimonas rosea]